MKIELVSNEELNRAKEILIAGLKFSLESTDDVANFFGGQELLKGEILTPKEKIAKIKQVTALDLQRVANQTFKEDRLNLALIGPFKDSKKLLKSLKF
jgi:predicted Zn-dependent peptidase